MTDKAKLMTPRLAVTLWLAVTVAAAGCGATHGATRSAAQGGAKHPASHGAAARGQTAGGAANPPAFAWLRPAPPPAGWPVVRLPSAAVLAYPPGLRRIASDAGTASAARTDPRSGLITEYLNVTPRQGDETLANWASFRPAHNREEGDVHEHVLSSAQDLRFRDGRGSCVIDRYGTSRTSYEEIACLVRGRAGQSVIVAAAQTARWAQSAPVLERVVSAFEA